MKQKRTCAQGAGRALRGQGCCFCLLVVRSVLWCVPLMNNRRTTKTGGTEERQANKRAKTLKTNRQQRGCGFICLFRGDPVSYIVISFPISCDITRYDISTYRIHIPNFEDSYRDIVSRRNISRSRTLLVHGTTQAGNRIMRTDEGIHKNGN